VKCFGESKIDNGSITKNRTAPIKTGIVGVLRSEEEVGRNGSMKTGIFTPCHPLLREAWVVRAMCCFKIEPLRCYTLMRLAANDMPPLTIRMLADEAAVTEASARQVLKLLRAEGFIDFGPNKSYHLTMPKGMRALYSIIHISTKRPVPDRAAHLDQTKKQFFDWAGLSRIKGKRQKKESWAKRELREIIQRSSPEEFREMLAEYGMKPVRESETALKPGHANEKRWGKKT